MADAAGAARQMGVNNAIFEFCMRHSDDPQRRAEGIPERDKRDYDWLKEALAQIKSDAERMEAALRIVKDDTTTQSKVCALEEIQFFVEDLDNAMDFLKKSKGGLDGGPTILEVVKQQSEPELREAALHIISTCAQNNPVCQRILAEDGALQLLFDQLAEPQLVTHKHVGALAGIVRGCLALEEQFHAAQGAERLLLALIAARDNHRVCKKILFLLLALWENRPDDAPALAPPPAPPALVPVLVGFLREGDGDLREMAARYMAAAAREPRSAQLMRDAGVPGLAAAVQREKQGAEESQSECEALAALCAALG